MMWKEGCSSGSMVRRVCRGGRTALASSGSNDAAKVLVVDHVGAQPAAVHRCRVR